MHAPGCKDEIQELTTPFVPALTTHLEDKLSQGLAAQSAQVCRTAALYVQPAAPYPEDVTNSLNTSESSTHRPQTVSRWVMSGPSRWVGEVGSAAKVQTPGLAPYSSDT